LDALPDHESRFAVIIMSALDAYALHAHKYGALGYLVKPFDAGELLSALERAVRKVDLMRLAAQAQARANANVPTLLNGTTTASQSETLLHAQLRDASGMIVLAASMIAVCEAFSGYTKCTLVDGVSHLITNTLDDCEKSLTRAEMLRIERGTLINLAYCMGWEADGRNAIALMEGGQRLTVSKRMKSTFVAKMKARAGGK
jgi:two-component system LytT family response regulator